MLMLRKLKDVKIRTRIRIGDLRILYRIDRNRRSIIIFDIGYRGKMY